MRDKGSRIPAMPVLNPVPSQHALRWFASPAGQAVLECELDTIHHALHDHPAAPWLWLAPEPLDAAPEGRGLQLVPDAFANLPDDPLPYWDGDVRCSLPLPLAMDSCGCVVLQHVLDPRQDAADLLDECARVLMPGGWLLLFGLNPLSPCRRYWLGSGLRAVEPRHWRRQLRRAGLTPDAVSEGLGPVWSIDTLPAPQQGPGLRVAYVVRAQKRRRGLTPVRSGRLLLAADGAAP